MDRAIYDRMAEIDRDHWWFSARRKIIDRLIRDQVPLKAGAQILEMGCGTGSNIALLQQFGHVDAVEPDDPARELASRRTGVAVKGGVDLADGHYDLVAMLDVLEHIPDDLEALRALRPKLAPGGRIVVTVPAGPGLWSAHDVAHHHHRRYTNATLAQVFTSAGYRVRHITHFNTALYPLIVAARAVGKLLKREGGDDAIPPKPVNALLERLFAAERHWVGRRTLPFGVSLAIVAEPATTR
jgi:SAM-dependent methyltransferase